MSPQNLDKKLPTQVQALHELLDEAETDADLDFLAAEEDQIYSERGKTLGSTPKLGELAIQGGTIVELSQLDAQRAAGQEDATPYSGNRRA